MNQLFGKYRATVVANVDPNDQGRLQIDSKDAGIAGVWAEACVPGIDPSRGVMTLPAIESQVWIEFEAGDIDRPIWTGVPWPKTPTPQPLTLRSPSGSSISLSPDGSIEIVAVGALRINAATISVSTGSAEVQAAALELNTPSAGFTGVIQCETLIASGSVVSPVYSPGVGNVW
jgi:hypothetical protein